MKLRKGQKWQLRLYMLAIFLLAVSTSADAVTINTCTKITTPGTYTLGADIIDSPADMCIIIASNDVTLNGNGHTIDGADRWTTFGIYVHDPETALKNVSIKNVKVTDWSYGIYYKAAILGTISNSIANSNYYGIFLDSYAGRNRLTGNTATSNQDGYHTRAGYNTIDNNKALTNNYGFVIYQTQKNVLTNNEANYENNGNGFYLYQSSNNTLTNNKALQWRGFWLYSSRYNTIANNDASNSNRGIELNYNSNNTVRDNTLNGKDYGIVLYDADYNTMTRNKVTGVATSGIWTQYSDNNLIYDNIFNNTVNFFNQGSSTNKWNIAKKPLSNIVNGPYTAGNVWETPIRSGFSQICGDTNHDGICDSAFPLDSTNIDSFPIWHPYTTDKSPPRSVTGLKNVSYARNYIKWTWTDPTNTDFQYVKIYLDGVYKTNILKGVKSYNATGLKPGTTHVIGTKTVDWYGNQNATTVTKSAKTKS